MPHKDTQVLITDWVQSCLDLAKQWGADRVVNVAQEDPYQAVEEFTNGEGAGAVIEAVGLEATIRQSMEFVAPSGRIAILGLSEGDLKLPVILLIKKGVDFHGSRLNCNQFPGVISLWKAAARPQAFDRRGVSFRPGRRSVRSFDSREEVTKVLLKF